MKYFPPIAIAALVALPVAASAADKPKAQTPPPIVQDVVACRAIADATARLGCYDQAAAALDRAVTTDQLVVMDKSQVREARRSLFGFTMPKIKIFGGGGSDELKQIDTNVTAVSRDPDARLVFGTAEGATWHQIDDRPTFDVKSDTKVSISAAAFGSYFAKFEHGAPIRVRRDR